MPSRRAPLRYRAFLDAGHVGDDQIARRRGDLVDVGRRAQDGQPDQSGAVRHRGIRRPVLRVPPWPVSPTRPPAGFVVPQWLRGSPRRTNNAEARVPTVVSPSLRSDTGIIAMSRWAKPLAGFGEVGVQARVDDRGCDVVERGAEPVPDLVHLLQRQRQRRETSALLERLVGGRVVGEERQTAFRVDSDRLGQRLAKHPHRYLVDRPACDTRLRTMSVTLFSSGVGSGGVRGAGGRAKAGSGTLRSSTLDSPW